MNKIKISYEAEIDKSEVLVYNTGAKLRYGKGTMKGIAWCTCEKCVGNLCIIKDRIFGWFEPVCSRCGAKLDWSDAEDFVKSDDGIVLTP